METTWNDIKAIEEEKRVAYLKTLEPEKWKESVKSIIHSLLFLEKPEEWATKWIEIGSRIRENNKLVAFPLPDEDIEMMYITMSDEKRPKTLAEAAEDEEKEIRKRFAENKTKGTYSLAEYLVRKYSIITVGEHEREMSVYRDGMYFRAENELIFPEIQRVLGENVSKSAKMETFHKIADMTSCPRSIFTSASLKYIPLKNGVYDIESGGLLDHSPAYKFTFQFPVVYARGGDCMRTREFFKQVLTEEQEKVMQEWIGYYFYRQYLFKKAVIFVGEGDTGKTTLLEVIINLLGRDNISAVSLHKMSADKFSAAHLYGKHGNIVDELSARDISDTGNFKVATGGGSISGEYKYGNQFSFLNYSKFTFACNKVPDVEDFDDEAYFGRWMILRFDKTIEKKIPNFINQLTSEEERSGLFNWAMEGLQRLLTQGKFSYNKDAMEIKKEMMRSGSSIAMFCSEGVGEGQGYEVTKEDMYDAYAGFCVERGIPAESIKMLGMKFLFYVTYASEGLITIVGKNGKPDRKRGWRNVQIVSKKEEKDGLDSFGEE